MRALVVDDASVMRKLLSDMAQELGFDPVVAEDGADALTILNKVGTVDLMLVDANMPKMNGLELIREVRKGGAHADTKIMMVSSETEMDKISEALHAGANEYIMKPFTKDAMREKLALLGLVRP